MQGPSPANCPTFIISKSSCLTPVSDTDSSLSSEAHRSAAAS